MSSSAHNIPNSKRNPLEDDYEIGDVLGDGQYSVVKMGINKKTGEEVAIKFVHRSQTEINELINEVELMREVVDHPGFVKLKEVYEDPENFILVMDLVHGGELFDKIAQLSTYNEERVAKLVQQITSALAYLHSKNIVHRDLKPENLLFVDEEATTIKLCDFGVAEKVPENGFLTEIIGTESYMAPEVEAGKPYGVSSDLYGLGILMYIMLCGYPPFEPENGIVDLEFPDEEWADISKTVKDLITSLLSKVPEERPSADEVLRHPWISGEKTNKENLPQAITTMKIFNQYRASGNFGSIRAVKGKKEAVWALFSETGNKKKSKKKAKVGTKQQLNGSPNVHSKSNKKDLSENNKKKLTSSTKIDSPMLLMKNDSKEKLERSSSTSSKKKKVDSIISPRPSVMIKSSSSLSNLPIVAMPLTERKFDDTAEKKKDSKSDLGRLISPRNNTSSGTPGSALKIKPEPDLRNTVYDPSPSVDETVTLLECKIVSLSNINCALQSQIDEISAAYIKMKLERDDVAKDLEAAKLELELFKIKKEKKKDKKEKKQS